MDWIELKIHTTHGAMEAVTHILNENGANGVVIKDSADLTKEKESLFGEIYELDEAKFPNDGVFIKAYFKNNEQTNTTLHNIRREIDELQSFGIDLGNNDMTTKSIIEEDWATSWKKHYKPTAITENITIVPSWEQYETTKHEEKIIKMDPGMAFGTGTHPTTILSVRALEKHLNKDELVIDVGCGSGILSIAALVLGANHVYAFDLDEVAVTSTSVNSELNNLKDNITVKQSNLLQGVDIKANVIVSNILAHILIDLINDVDKNLAPAGKLILSGIIEKKEADVTTHLEDNGFKLIARDQMENWISLVAQKE